MNRTAARRILRAKLKRESKRRAAAPSIDPLWMKQAERLREWAPGKEWRPPAPVTCDYPLLGIFNA